MRIAPEGYALVVGAFVVAAVIVILTSVYGPAWLKAVGYVLGALIVGFVLWFFRDPVRTPPADADRLLLAPADGKVIEIVEEDEPLYIKGKATRISIFLSPLNVHVNRSPATGTVEFDQYVPGDYLVAWHPKASELNERSQLGLRHAGSGEPVLFKQIAGAVARRIVYHVGVGDELSAGERFGIVKFGSRMDIFVREGVEITTNIGDRVTAGETIIGSFPAGS
ncbi:MAG: phosphatidylserine decarboxylase family protein [Bacteroidetes bacterium]|jgi:phosphatidylserine decarboxylase|nr:phosphatidylserine decarboxylase family protein [Bacteroidota bacterium]